MRPDITYAALADMRVNIALIEDFIGGFTSEIFELEWKTRYATLHALEIILEAGARLPNLKDRQPDISWTKMRAAASVERKQHDCDSAAQLWKVASENPPPLLAIVEAELAAAGLDRDRLGHVIS